MFYYILLILLIPSFIFSNWQKIDLGYMYGHWDFSVGTHVWADHIVLRNAQLQHTMYLSPGLRAHSILRSNRSFEGLDIIEPYIDELYLEKFAFWRDKNTHFSWSLKAGQTRYLRFPSPDIISMYDQVPGTEDLRRGGFTAYKGIMMTQESMYKKVGAHFTGILWVDSPYKNFNSIEEYLFFKPSYKQFDIEARWGRLARRLHPLGLSSLGYSIHLGYQMKGYRAGILYEYLEKEGIRTGVLVEFSPSFITRFLGKYRFDFTRAPMGFGFQPTLLKGVYGFKKAAPKGYKKVGEVVARRIITYWQNGQGRNFYEHIISHTGSTLVENDTLIVLEEKPRYLQIESLVSLHNQFRTWNDVVTWEEKRQGPAQLSQIVIYSYFRKP